MSASNGHSQLLSAKKQETNDENAPCESDQNTKLLALAEEVAHFGSWIWDVTQPKAIWSPELFRIFGLEPRDDGLTLEEYTSFIHPDDISWVGKRIQDNLTNAKLNEKEVIDYRIIRRDGSVRIIHSQRLMKELNEKGKLKVIVGVDQDVTEQKQAEETLKRSEERFRAVAEAANVLVYEMDLVSGCVQIIRGEKELVGFEPVDGETRDANWALSRMHPDDVPKVVATWNWARNDPAVDRYSMEYRLKHANGGYIIVKDTAKAVKDPNGKTLMFIGGIRDITQRRRDQERIEKYSKHLEELVVERTKQLVAYERLAAIGQTAGMVGHDIRNPLQAIESDVYLIKSEEAKMPQGDAKVSIQESLESIEQGIGYINKIVADLQDYSRELRPEFSETDLAQLVAGVFQGITVPPNIQVVFDIRLDSTVNLEPTYTRRGLSNLVNNALQAMPNGGKLKVSAYMEGNYLYITIEDTGVGIPQEVQTKIFTPMFTTKAKGQGLGLAVVKRLIEAQGGAISFESQAGKGTKFQIKLPERS